MLEYSVVINLLFEAIFYGIKSLVVYLDSQLVVPKLNNIYRVRDPPLHHQFMTVRLFQILFNFITFIHIS